MQLLQYNLTHPYPRSRLFTTITFVLIALVLPVLVIVNIITVGHELVPSLRQDFQQNDTVPSWWATTPVAPLLRRKAPLCQPKDFGRGDTFRLSPSLFEYKVLSSWRTNATNVTSEDEGRVEYRGGSFDQCIVYSIRFDLNVIESTQTLTVGIMCPDFPVRAFLETRIVFATEVSKDVVGQYYGYGLDPLSIVDGESHDYHRLVFDILDVMSTDSVSILDWTRVNWLSFSTRANVDPDSTISFPTTYIMARNGTGSMFSNNTLGEAEVYRRTIVNLMRAVQHAVELDLGNPSSNNIFMHPLAMNHTFDANLPPSGVAPETWVDRNSFHYGLVEKPYLTFAAMLRAGVPSRITAALGNLTGLPTNSTMITSYMCPSYQVRPMSSLLANVFIGTATMFLSAWAAWTFVTAMIAKRIRGPCVTCTCGALLDPENLSMRCDHGHAVVASGLATGLVRPPPNVITRSNTGLGSVFTSEKGESGSRAVSIQEVPKMGPAVGTGV
ncbi:unnamed protein product [Rhizoctonia solani]|uniref:Transmembrane protein n=1 Tax=Rhizoctonia solani TaxID=456999 RepID=A0A8H2XPJ8_9AGAM|nr:unnamed protein product [Rhizoctonia solani]